MKPTSSNKESILAITLLLLLFFIYFRNINLIYAALVFIIFSLLSNQVAGFFDKGWKYITHVLGIISSTIILSVIFYGIVFPWSLILKLIKKDSLLLNSRIKTTTFITRNKLFTKTDLQNPY